MGRVICERQEDVPVHNTEDSQIAVWSTSGRERKKPIGTRGYCCRCLCWNEAGWKGAYGVQGRSLRERPAREVGYTCAKSRELRLPESRGFNEAASMGGDMREAYGARRLRTLSKGRSRGVRVLVAGQTTKTVTVLNINICL